MKSSVALITELVQPTIEALGLQLWGIEHLSQGKFSLLRIYIESDEGILIEDCEKVSRQVSALLDVEDPITGEYTLEVSSPGIDRPLFALEQFQQYIGETVNIKTRGPVNGRRKFKGTIAAIEDESVVVQIDGEDYTVSHGEIDKAVLVY
ncbi:MAG: ribosome maturation factor RimP [Gammaproteobacteria bacterium]